MRNIFAYGKALYNAKEKGKIYRERRKIKLGHRDTMTIDSATAVELVG